MRKTRFRSKSERGQAMVEFAIVVPLLLMVLMGIMQLGVVYNNWVTLTDASRAGGRQAAVSRGLADPSGTTVARVKASAVNLDQTQLKACASSSTSGTPPSCPAPSWTQGSDVTVIATYPYGINVMGVVVASGTLTATTTERVE